MIKELLDMIVKALVDYPDQVAIKEIEYDNMIVFELSVAKEEMGKIIGKQGKIAKSIRTVIKAAAIKCNKKVTIEII